VPPAAGAKSLVHYAVLETKRRRTGVSLISRSQTSRRGTSQAAHQGTQPGIATNRAQNSASGGTRQSGAPGATGRGGPAAGQRERSDSKDHCQQIRGRRASPVLSCRLVQQCGPARVACTFTSVGLHANVFEKRIGRVDIMMLSLGRPPLYPHVRHRQTGNWAFTSEICLFPLTEGDRGGRSVASGGS
jgi:hypothetical protein